MASAENFRVRLLAARFLSPMVRELSFERIDGRALGQAPGQWVNLFVPTRGETTRRSYSVASPPANTSSFDLAVTHVSGGAASEYLHTLSLGGELDAAGPYGLFTRSPDEQSPSLFVATGTGVTPLRAMLLAAAERNALSPSILLFGARHEADLIYAEEFHVLASKNPAFRYEPTLSRPGATWRGRTGYVQTHVAELWKTLPGDPCAYICGLERMVATTRDFLRNDLGVDRKRTRTERYD